MKLKTALCAFLSAICALAYAQDEISFMDEDASPDFRSRLSVSLGGGIGRYCSWQVEEEIRIKDSFGSFDRFNTSVTFGYKPVKWLKIAPAYHLFNIHDVKKSTGEKEWKARHRVALNMTASISAGRWKFSLRERPQVTMRTDSINVMEKCRASFVLRSRAQVEYSFRRIPLDTYVSAEITNTLNTPKEFHGLVSSGSPEVSFKLKNHISRIRYFIGASYRFDKRNSIDVNYRIDDGKDYDIHITKNKGYLKSVTKTDYLNHILCIGYSYKF